MGIEPRASLWPSVAQPGVTMKVQDAVCLVTGSAQGLGKAFAVRLLTAGARVCISDVREEGGLATLKELREKFGEKKVTFVQCDVTKPEQFTRLFDECESYFNVPCIDLLVNNAGINTNWGWRKCMEVNIIGVMNGTEIALERMKKQPKKGTIVNTASMAGIMTGGATNIGCGVLKQPPPGEGFAEDALPYFVSKHGVVTLTRTLNASFQESGVEVKALCPSWADTEIVSGAEGEERQAALKKLVSLHGGLMTVEFVAEAFHSLVTECPRGSVMGCIRGVPYFIIPDTSETMVKMLVMMGILMNKLTGATTIQVGDYKKVLVVVIGLLMLLAYIF